VIDLGPGIESGMNDFDIRDRFDTHGVATLFTRDGMRELGTLPGGRYSIGSAINDLGVAVGYSDAPTSTAGTTYIEHGF
jgi:hypothetical protein